MPDYFCTSCTTISIPVDKIKKAADVVDPIIEELETNEGWCGCWVDYNIDEGFLTIQHEENFSQDHAERILRALVDELDLPDTYIVSWSYTCSRQIDGEFGGGAFAIRAGHPTIWVDNAKVYVEQKMAELVSTSSLPAGVPCDVV